MKDTIYRENAIKALEELSACKDFGVEIGTDEETYIGKYEAITAISDLPSADRPQLDKDVVEPIGNGNVIMSEDTYEEMLADRPQGEWLDYEIPLEDGGAMPIQVCSLCKTFYPLAFTGGGHRFCPNCGASMLAKDTNVPNKKGADDEVR